MVRKKAKHIEDVDHSGEQRKDIFKRPLRIRFLKTRRVKRRGRKVS